MDVIDVGFLLVLNFEKYKAAKELSLLLRPPAFAFVIAYVHNIRVMGVSYDDDIWHLQPSPSSPPSSYVVRCGPHVELEEREQIGAEHMSLAFSTTPTVPLRNRHLHPNDDTSFSLYSMEWAKSSVPVL